MPALLSPNTAVAGVTLRSADRARAEAFYRDIAGLEELGNGELGWEGAPLVRIVDEGVASGRAPRAATGLFHTALRYSDRGTLGRALERVLRAGLLTGASDHGVSEAIYLDDPDGNGVELYVDRPREAWPPPGPGEKVGMFTAPLDLESLLEAGQSSDPDPASVVDIGHVHLKVSDLPRSLAFWTDTVGLEKMTGYGDQAAFIAAGGYHHHVGLNTWMSRGAAPGSPELPGLDEVRLRVGGVEDLAALRARLEAAGAPVEERDGALVTRDPDEIRLVALAD